MHTELCTWTVYRLDPAWLLDPYLAVKVNYFSTDSDFAAGKVQLLIFFSRPCHHGGSETRFPLVLLYSCVNCWLSHCSDTRAAKIVSFLRTGIVCIWHCTVQVENLVITHPVTKLPTLYGTRRFITVFTTARHWSVSWAICIQSTPSLRSILILSYR